MTRADDFEQRAIIARATVNALAITTGLRVPARMRAQQLAGVPAEARRGCLVCGDATGIRCCEFGATR